MDYNIDQQSPLEYTLTLTFSAKEFNAQVTKKTLASAKKIHRKGFRSGQIPLQVAKTMLGQSLYYETAAELAEGEYQTIIEKENIELAGMPELNVTYAEEAKGAECVLSYSTYPNITLPEWNTLKVDITRIINEEDDYQAVIEVMRERNPIWTETAEPAQEKNRVTLDFAGKLNDEAFAGGTAESQQLVLGDSSFLPDFEKALVGMRAGETKTAPVAFPDDYQSKELAGQTAQFELRVIKVEAAQLPEFDETFFLSQGSQAKTADDFASDIKNNVKRHVKSLEHEHTREACMKALADAVQFDVPQRVVAQEARHMQQEALAWLERSGNKIDAKQKETLFPLEQFTERATQRVSQWLLFQAVIKKLDLQVSDADIDAFLQEENDAQPDHVREQAIVRLKNNPEEKRQVEAAVLERKTFATLCETAQVNYLDKPYMEHFKQTA